MAKKLAKTHLKGEELSKAFEVERKRTLVVDKFYPALVGATVSVDEAKMLMQSISSLMMEDVLSSMKSRKFAPIVEKAVKSLCPNGDREVEVRALLETLVKEDLLTAREIVEGMSNAIEQMILEDMQGRTLNSFSPNWDKMLAKKYGAMG